MALVNGIYDWQAHEFEVGDELDVLDTGDEIWCHATVLKIDGNAPDRVIKVHWTGWESSFDVDIEEEDFADRLTPPGMHVKKVKCWVTLLSMRKTLPKWPAVVYIRVPRSLRGQQCLQEEAKVRSV